MKKIFYLLLFISTRTLNAQTHLMDNFNYGANDSLIGVNYNNGWLLASSTINPLRANTSGLTFTGYNGSGIGNSVNMLNNGQDAYKGFSNGHSYSSGSVFVSFMANVSAAQATGDYFFALLPNTSTTAFSARTYIRLSSPGYFRVAIMRGSTASETTVYSSDSFALNSTHLFVAKYTFNSNSLVDDSVRLYVFSSSIPATEPTNAVCAALGGTTPDLPNVARVVLRQGSASAAATLLLDGIRVSNSWANGPLPVSLHSFTGTTTENGNLLNWITSSEQNNKGFEIERSENAIDFETIAFIKGAGNSQTFIKYQHLDQTAHSTSNFYRLKQLDFDGKSTYSEMISISSEINEVAVSPNPFNNKITLQSNQSNKIISAEVIDITGKTKISIQGEVNGNIEIDTQHLNNGVYFLRVTDGGTTQVNRIIKN